jgi:hypothetical protein
MLLLASYHMMKLDFAMNAVAQDNQITTCAKRIFDSCQAAEGLEDYSL